MTGNCLSTERPASGQGFSMKRRSSRCATLVLEHERCRANTKQRRRETARCAAEGATAPPGLKTPFSPGIASAPSPVRALATALTRKRTDGATRKPPVHPSRHEKACAPVSKLRWHECHASRKAAEFRDESLRVNHCDVAKSGLRVDARSLFVPRREACRAFVSAPRAAFVSVGASRPEGVTGARRRRGKPSGLRRGGVSPQSIGGTPMTRRRFRGLRQSRRDNTQSRLLSRRERIAFPAEAPCGRAIRGDRAPRIGSALPPKTFKTFDAWGAVGLRDFCVKNLCGLCVETCSGRVQETFAECAKHSFRDTPLALRRGSVFF